MSRAEFWGRKLLLADSLGTETVRNLLNTAEAEIVSRKQLEGEVTIIEFTDGSFLRARPFDTPNNKMGWVDWTK